MLRSAAVAMIALVLGLALTRLLMLALGKLKMQQIIREQGPEAHQKKAGTLTMGGIGFFLATPLALAAAGVLGGNRMLIALAAGSACFLLGLADDLSKFMGKKTEGLKARYRFLIQIALGAALGWYVMKYVPSPTALRLPVGWPVISLGPLFIPFAAIVFSGTLNSVNFTDGLDGLLGGCTLVVCAAFAVYLAKAGGPEEKQMIPLLAALGGAVAGFLWFNAHPASLFMGDTGSLYIGGIIGAVAILSRAEIFLVVAGMVFVAEAMSVVLQVASFRLTGKRIFKMSPIHHHFELAGWAETQVVTRFWIVSAVFSGAALLLFAR